MRHATHTHTHAVSQHTACEYETELTGGRQAMGGDREAGSNVKPEPKPQTPYKRNETPQHNTTHPSLQHGVIQSQVNAAALREPWAWH